MSVVIAAVGPVSPAISAFMYSNDQGSTWAFSSPPTILPTASSSFAISSNGSMFVAGGVLNQLLVSTNGIDWMPKTLDPSVNRIHYGGYGNGRWLIGTEDNGNAGYLYTSMDNGSTWTLLASGNIVYYSIAYNGSIWVTVGRNLTTLNYFIGYSSDNGNSWTLKYPSDTGFSFLSVFYPSFVKWNGVSWLAIGTDSTLDNSGSVFAFSADGINWTSGGNQADSGSTTIQLLRSTFWNGSYWIATGYDITNTFFLFVSPDGTNWTSRSFPTTPTTTTRGITWANGIWLVGIVDGNIGNDILKSLDADGTNWTYQSSMVLNEVLSIETITSSSPDIFVSQQTLAAPSYQNIHLPSGNDIVPYTNFAVVPGIPNPQPHPPGTYKQPRQAKNVINRCFGSLTPNKPVPDPCAQPRSPHEKRHIQASCSGVVAVADYNARLNNYRRADGVYQVGFQQSPRAKVVATWPPMP